MTNNVEAMKAWRSAYERLRGAKGYEIKRFLPKEYDNAIKRAFATVEPHTTPAERLKFYRILQSTGFSTDVPLKIAVAEL